MKKSIIALAVAGALTAPMIAQADATVYGVAQYRGVMADGSSFYNKMAKTRLGVKGTVDNDVEGLTTGYQFEWEFNGNGNVTGSTVKDGVTLRKSNVYMKGDFGIVAFGRQNNPVNAGEAKTDILGNNSASFHKAPDRLGNVAAYVSPKFGGAEVYVGFVADGAADPSDDADGTVFGVNWSGMGVSVNAGMQQVTDVSDTLVLGASYTGVENLYLAASYSSVDNDAAAAADPANLDLAASYTMGKTTLGLIYSTNDVDVSGADDQSVVVAGVRYKLGAKASVGVDYAMYDEDTTGPDTLVLEYTLAF